MTLGLRPLFRRRQAAWVTFVGGLALTAALGWHLHREAVAMDRQRLAMRVAEITSQLDARLEKSEMLLHNLRDYLLFSGENRNKVFERWCYENGLSINCRWLHGIVVATNRHAVQWRLQLPPDPETWTTNECDTMYRLARQHPIECDIAMRSEVSDQKQFLADYGLGVAFLDEDSRWSGNWLAVTIRQSSRLGMSDQRAVMLDASGNAIAGTLFYVPMHNPEIDRLTTISLPHKHTKAFARWLDLETLIVAPVDFKALEQSLWDGAPADVGIELFSSTNQSAATWLNISEGVPRAADPNFKPYLKQQYRWRMYGLTFTMFFYTTPLFEAQSPRRLAKVSTAVGTILTLLAAALVGVAQRARNRQEILTEQIREARDALTAAQQERNKISRDLHDGTIQSLYAIQLGLEQTAEKLTTKPAQAQRELSSVYRELDGVIAEIRQFVTTEAGAEKSVDFSAVLHALVQRARTGTKAQIVLAAEPAASERLSGDQAVHLANIAREALSNSLRHAKPQRVQIAFRAEPETVVLEISDDGSGFDPQTPGRAGVGLISMNARAQEMSGTFEIQSSAVADTRILVRVPASAEESIDAESSDNSPNKS